MSAAKIAAARAALADGVERKRSRYGVAHIMRGDTGWTLCQVALVEWRKPLPSDEPCARCEDGAR